MSIIRKFSFDFNASNGVKMICVPSHSNNMKTYYKECCVAAFPDGVKEDGENECKLEHILAAAIDLLACLFGDRVGKAPR